jgi:hypothetical protein
MRRYKWNVNRSRRPVQTKQDGRFRSVSGGPPPAADEAGKGETVSVPSELARSPRPREANKSLVTPLYSVRKRYSPVSSSFTWNPNFTAKFFTASFFFFSSFLSISTVLNKAARSEASSKSTLVHTLSKI